MRITDQQLVNLFKEKFTENCTDSLALERVIPSDRLKNDHVGLYDRIVQSLAPDSIEPACAIYPQTIAELSQAITIANDQHLRILPVGSGTKLDWGGLVSRADVVVSTAKLDQIVEHCVGDLTVTVEAGVNYQQLQAILAKEGQFLAIDPAYADVATVGGIVATGSAGSLRHRYNGVRDMCLGIEFVRSDGQVVKAGGRVVKNVAGYDLMKLLTASYGTLGVISSLTFRLYPLPEYTQVVVLTGEDAAIAQAQKIISASVLTPVTFDLLSRSAIAALGYGDRTGLALQFANLKSSVIDQGDRLYQIAKTLGLQIQIIGAAEVDDFWQRLNQVFWQPKRRQILSQENHDVVCKFGLLPTSAISMIQQCQQIWTEQEHHLQIHLGSGLGILRLENIPDLAIASAQIEQVREITQASSGFLTILEAPHRLKFHQNVWGDRQNHGVNSGVDLMQKIRQQFDPQGLLSPDRYKVIENSSKK